MTEKPVPKAIVKHSFVTIHLYLTCSHRKMSSYITVHFQITLSLHGRYELLKLPIPLVMSISSEIGFYPRQEVHSKDMGVLKKRG